MLYRSDKRNSLRATCLYSAVDFEIFLQLLLQQWIPLKVLDFELQMPTGPTVGAIKKFPFLIRSMTVKWMPSYRDSIEA